MLAVRLDGERALFDVRVTPRAAANAIAGERDGVLLMRVTASPVDGKANAALIALLAKMLGVAQGAVRLERGATARKKSLSIPRAALPALRALTK